MDVRLMGLPEEVQQALVLLSDVFEIVSVRGPYQNRARGRSFGLPDRTVRAYVDVRPRGDVERGGVVYAESVRADCPGLGADEPRQLGYPQD